jgi:hypothetical protein
MDTKVRRADMYNSHDREVVVRNIRSEQEVRRIGRKFTSALRASRFGVVTVTPT